MKEFKWENIKTYSIKERKNKLNIKDFIKLENNNFLEIIPDVFKAKELKILVEKLKIARENKKKIVWMVGDAVIKCGLAPLLVELAKNGFLTSLSGQGAVAIHDIEIALIGETSEDVSETIKDGRFGMAKETGEFFAKALERGRKENKGMGEILPLYLEETNPPFKEYSLIYNLYKLNIPMTFHVAIGTDITHIHPLAKGEDIGFGTFKDFQRFCEIIKDLEEGVILNIASAVIMPEVFLKALSVVRNLGFNVKKFTACNIDQIQHYRGIQNVVLRPTQEGGKGLSITANIEIFLPVLGLILLERI
ncbi:MAG: hypothetical protein ABIM29_07035 [candidate division WOR-3 bacterium]